ncbi:carbohydrate ABC transporter permease [Haloplasma contractile]|uniref:Binding-protein-dependent transport systems inner membrane component n=1 Tax=Haloplasma contractile SSD-17B TaxID=1033810 RepID=U2DSY0_9MOLU|nr:carbohydrate ABC transporter permease [Haloplasma contractile]ERJ11602.1 Binding-protein-dependent transport systems inner membrane component [Haloplasma contractile SSD-17B]
MSLQGTKINPKNFHRSQLKWYLILIPLALVMLLPVVYIFSTAFKPLDELFMFPPRFLVQKPTLKNFQDLFRTSSTTGVPMTRYLFNSITVAVVMISITIIISTMGGYVLSKKQFKAKQKLFSINQMALMFVITAVVIPRYLIVARLGLLNTFWAHIIPYLATPVYVFLVKQFIDQIPDSIIEAAKLDGANDLHIIFKIIIPLTKPALATVAMLTFQFTWGNPEPSNWYIQDETLKSFSFYILTLTNQQQNITAGAGMAAAAGLILFLPNLIMFIFMQSRIMNTMSHSGIK